MTEPVQTAILFSGRGSNMRTLIEAAQASDYPAAIACTITDNPQAEGIAYTRSNDVPCEIFNPGAYDSKQALEAELHKCLTGYNVELICLAGFMRILSADFIGHWPGRIINIHPSLLPAYKGLNTHNRVLANGDSETGCSVHYVDAGIDSGAIIAQKPVPVHTGDDAAALEKRVRAAEHELYPAALAEVAHKLLNPGPHKA
jgi:phosphoribosylglycinamide formyltransferase-1